MAKTIFSVNWYSRFRQRLDCEGLGLPSLQRTDDAHGKLLDDLQVRGELFIRLSDAARYRQIDYPPMLLHRSAHPLKVRR